MTSTDAIGESLELEVCEFYGFHVEDWQRGCVWFNVGGKVLLFSLYVIWMAGIFCMASLRGDCVEIPGLLRMCMAWACNGGSVSCHAWAEQDSVGVSGWEAVRWSLRGFVVARIHVAGLRCCRGLCIIAILDWSKAFGPLYSFCGGL